MYLCSSFLGNGSEILISSVFEATPPTSRFDTSSTPPKASSVTSGDLHDSDEDGDDRHHHKDGGLPGSPLAKVFGRPQSRPPKSRHNPSQDKAPHVRNPTSLAMGDELDTLKVELSEMRASQLRMEEMLSKMLSGTGSDGK